MIWLITGANRGLGLEMCRQLLAGGHDVIATAREPETAGELGALGPRRLEALDVGEASSVTLLAEKLAGERIDILINNAGIGGRGTGIRRLDGDALEHFFAVNAVGPLRVTRALLPCLERGERRTVAFISSQMGSLTSSDAGGAYGYRASKAALNMLQRCLAQELRPAGFRTVSLHPGWVRTDMGGSQAPLSPAESVAGVLKVIENLTPKQSGTFLDYLGEPLPW